MAHQIEEQKKRLIEKLQNNPLISYACKSINISRSTFYRWKEEDDEFKTAVKKSQMMGRAIICDAAESKLLNLLNSFNEETVFKVAKFLLLHLHPVYKNSNESVQYQRSKFKDEILREKEKSAEIIETAINLLKLLMENGRSELKGEQSEYDKIKKEKDIEEIKNKLLLSCNNNQTDNMGEEIKKFI